MNTLNNKKFQSLTYFEMASLKGGEREWKVVDKERMPMGIDEAGNVHWAVRTTEALFVNGKVSGKRRDDK